MPPEFDVERIVAVANGVAPRSRKSRFTHFEDFWPALRRQSRQTQFQSARLDRRAM